MTIRKHDDSVKPGCGIDGTEGEDFTKRSSDPWNPPEFGGERPYVDDSKGGDRWAKDRSETGLRTKKPDEDPEQGTRGNNARDIFNDVERNSGNGAPGPIKYGVD